MTVITRIEQIIDNTKAELKEFEGMLWTLRNHQCKGCQFLLEKLRKEHAVALNKYSLDIVMAELKNTAEKRIDL